MSRMRLPRKKADGIQTEQTIQTKPAAQPRPAAQPEPPTQPTQLRQMRGPKGPRIGDRKLPVLPCLFLARERFQTYDSYTILAMLPARIRFAAARWTAVAVSDQEACGLL